MKTRYWRRLAVAVLAVVVTFTGFNTIAAPPVEAIQIFGPYTAKTDIDGRATARKEDRIKTNAYWANDPVRIKCQDFGEQVAGSNIWDYTEQNFWIPDVYLKTGTDEFVAGVPRCNAIGIGGATAEAKNVFPAKVTVDGRGSLNVNDRVKVNAYTAGQPITVVCQEVGPVVNGNRVWDRTAEYFWVPDTYIQTGVNGFLPGIPRCSALSAEIDQLNAGFGGGFGPYKAKVDIDGRGSPNTDDRVKTNAYYKDQPVLIRCQDSGTAVNGNSVWDFTTNGYWIPDTYISTGVEGFMDAYSGVPRCSAIGVGDRSKAVGQYGPFPAKVAVDGRATPNPDDRVKTDAYTAGQPVWLICQDTGVAVNSNSVWGYTTTGYWIPDTYITTGINGFLPGVPKCSDVGVLAKGAAGRFGPFTAKVTLDGRTSINPEVRAEANLYPAGTGVYIKCQDLGPMVNGSTIWDYTAQNRWVPDTYLKTGTDDWLSYVPRCSGIGVAGGGTRQVPAGEASGVRGTIVAAARSKVGIAEWGDNCNPFGVNGVRCGAPWCTMFATWSWGQAGLGYRTDASWQLEAWGRRNGLLRTKATARPGDIVIYANRRDGGGNRHTGVIESVASDRKITTIEGNYGNKVTRVAGIDPNSPTPPHSYKYIIAIVSPIHDEAVSYQPPLTPDEQIEASRLRAIAPENLIDSDLGPAIDIADRDGDTVRLDLLVNQYKARSAEEERSTWGVGMPDVAARAPSGKAMVSEKVAAEILDNMIKGGPAWRTDQGLGNAAWFTTEGNPYTASENSEKKVPVNVELVRKGTVPIYDAKSQLEPRKEALKAKFRPTIRAEEIERFKIRNDGKSPPLPLSNTLNAKIERQTAAKAEAVMWEELGREVANSPEKQAEVVFKGSALSKQGDGKYLIIAEDSRILLKGGLLPHLENMRSVGMVTPETSPAVIDGANEVAKQVNQAGKVRSVFRWGGRLFIIIGISADIYQVVTADEKLETIIESVGGWTGATAGVVAFSAWWAPADAAGPWAWAGHGAGAFIAGGFGYWVGSNTARTIYRLVVVSVQQFRYV